MKSCKYLFKNIFEIIILYVFQVRAFSGLLVSPLSERVHNVMAVKARRLHYHQCYHRRRYHRRRYYGRRYHRRRYHHRRYHCRRYHRRRRYHRHNFLITVGNIIARLQILKLPRPRFGVLYTTNDVITT